MNIGSKIKYFREKRGFTQQELATKIHKTKSSLQKYENNQTSITIDILEDIANALDMSLVQFFYEDYDDLLNIIKDRFGLKDNTHGQLEYDFKLFMEILQYKYK